MKAFFFGLILFAFNSLHAQTHTPVFFDFCNYYWRYPIIKDTTTIDVRYNDKVSKLKVYLKDWKGECDFLLFSTNGALLLEGKYINSLAILRNYITVRTNGTDANTAIEIIDFYRPLRAGKWKHYTNGKIAKEENYSNGILIE